ncbi:MAG: response regulator [Cellvibrionaceae bacterium]|nr:response regulator [Cellvibrionaceae bacterium]
MTILIIDDDPVNRMVLQGMLKLHDYRVLEGEKQSRGGSPGTAESADRHDHHGCDDAQNDRLRSLPHYSPDPFLR